ncbi:hypothetical protein [Sphingorhabdus sp.]|jgi:hypothetical protein|uniref:hypothetical protein n=1 Tax=Sphingorhabdus sp. TaxID=1902408 RepID=UPI003BAF6009|nr:hypothetical protein [Sphingomonadales bacterium]MBK9432175.1 hypothetical protein [Sphingomonadales bacterium]MBL0023304.1 hypothetical protein [Sphingomonadales bacterium]
MLHHFFDKGPWFRAKRFGYGAGLPFKLQGWVLLLSHMAVMIGLAFLLATRPLIMMPLVLLIALAPMPIYAARTEGGWKWRGRPGD